MAGAQPAEASFGKSPAALPMLMEAVVSFPDPGSQRGRGQHEEGASAPFSFPSRARP
jgi:hypothetical protein